jgi:transaldolase
MLYKGIDITLLFSVRAYEAVAHAYIRAMERRVAESQPVHHVASVASFFLSRIDVLVDQPLNVESALCCHRLLGPWHHRPAPGLAVFPLVTP